MNHTLRKSIAALVSLGLAGCGQWGGGASVVPSVTMLPVNFGSAADSAGDSADLPPVAGESGAAAGGFGTFEGQVVLSGTAPVLAALIAAGADVKDKEVCAAVDVPDERLVVGGGGGVSNVFIFMQKAPTGGKPLPDAGDDVIFDQKNCRFLPHCLVIPTGRTVRVLSDDPIAHNTHTYPAKNQAINSGVAPNDREGVLNFKYQRAEAVPLSVTCDYHGWMKAYHLPVDHPYAAVTDADGKFSIPDLPSGTHTFAVWHESVDGNFLERRLTVKIQPDASTEIKIDLPVSRLAL